MNQTRGTLSPTPRAVEHPRSRGAGHFLTLKRRSAMKTRKPFLTLVAGGALAAAGLTQSAEAVILADDFTGVTLNNTTDEATIGSWDTVNGISAPSTTLTFIDGDSTTQLGFFDANAGMIDVNNNMTAGGWDTTITLAVGGLDIDLSSLVLDLKLTNGTGGSQTTASKDGQMLVQVYDAGSSLVGSADLGGNVSYPSESYQRTLDLAGTTLSAGQTYTMVVQARGTGFGHHKALDALVLNGDIVPEPGSLALLGLGGLLIGARRRRNG